MNLKQFVSLAAVLLALTCHLRADSEDLYNLLGISRKATTREIRQAFKKLALEKHPDKNQVKNKRHFSPSICKKLKPQSINVFYGDLKANRSEQMRVDKLSYKEIAQDLLQYLPDIQLLDNDAFQVRYSHL